MTTGGESSVWFNRLKGQLKEEGSWVANRGADALEKMGLDTFIGYLLRALSGNINKILDSII